MSEVLARVLSNIYLPPITGFSMRTFGAYMPEEDPPKVWIAENERRTLAEILPLIPKSETPDILVIASPEYLPIPVDIASFPGLKVLLITDWNVCLRFLPDLAPLFDFCFTDWPGYRLLKRGGLPNIHHQPMFGHDPSRFIIQDLPRNLDVSFCGNLNSGLHGERNRLLARIAKWGNKWDGSRLHLRQAFGEAYVEVLNRSRMVFNYSIRGEANMRLFESMAMGAIALVEEGNQEVGILFQEGKHYFKYAPEKLEACLENILADPARMASVTQAAGEEVKRHTKALQIQTLLEKVCRSSPVGASQIPAIGDVNLSPETNLAGRKALVKLRILGAGYSIQEAISEIQMRSEAIPGLEFETIPAALFTILDKQVPGSLISVEQTLEKYLHDPGLPGTLQTFLGMKLALWRGQWQSAIDEADKCRHQLSLLLAMPESVKPLYGYFHPPLDLGQGFNSDLNQSFREAFGGGKHQGYLELLQAHCHVDKAKALFALENFADAWLNLKSVPLARFASLDQFSALVSILFTLRDFIAVHELAQTWFKQKPLGTGYWDKLYEIYNRLGVKSDTVGFLGEIGVLAKAFLSQDQIDLIHHLHARELEKPD